MTKIHFLTSLLSIVFLSGNAQNIDAFEPNDDPLEDNLIAIQPDTNYTITLHIGSDRDWFLFHPDQVGNYEISISGVPAILPDFDIDITVHLVENYDPDEIFNTDEIFAYNWATPYNSDANLNVSMCPQEGPYYILITEGFADAASDEQLSLEITLIDLNIPDISFANGLLSATNPNADFSYQWYECESTDPIPGANSNTYSPEVTGSYQVEVDNGECVVLSDCIEVIIVSTQNSALENAITLFPNPSSDRVMLKSDIGIETVRLYDLTGKNVKSFYFGDQTGQVEMEVSNLNPGLYFCTIATEKGELTKKLAVR